MTPHYGLTHSIKMGSVDSKDLASEFTKEERGEMKRELRAYALHLGAPQPWYQTYNPQVTSELDPNT